MEFALPDLAGFAAAALLLILACAIALLASLLAQTLGRAPVIGDWITANIVAALVDASNAVLAASKATWNFMVGLFNWAADIFMKPYIYTVQYAIDAYRWIQHLATVTIPAAEQRALVYAAQLVTAVNSDMNTLFGDAERYASQAATAVETRADLLFTAAETYARNAVSAAQTTLVAEIRAVEAAGASNLTAVEHALSTAVTGVATAADSDLHALASQANGLFSRLANDIVQEATAVSATAAASLAAVRAGIYTDLDTWGTQAVTEAWPDAVHDLDALRQTLGGDFPWLNDLIPALAGAGAIGLLGALVRSMAAANVITNLADDCIVPNCRNLSGLGNALSELGSVAEAAALVAWLIFMVTDPQAAAQDMYDVAFEPMSAFASSISHLFGGP